MVRQGVVGRDPFGLPGLNGRQVADAARLALPHLPVLFMTGYAELAAATGGFLEPGMALIAKPFSIDTLFERVQQRPEPVKVADRTPPRGGR